MSIEQFENRAVLQILLFLRERGKAKLTDIKVHASSNTIQKALSTLARLELIAEERQKPYTRYIQLNGDGKAVAEKLGEIEAILEAKKTR